MKTLKVFIPAVLFLFVFALDAQAQNKSAENSQVIGYHEWFEFSNLIECGDLEIEFHGWVQQIVKTLPNGIMTTHYNAYGEGVDNYGGLWKWHDAWNYKYDGWDLKHEVRSLVLQGPKGAKLVERIVFVVNGNGEIVKDIYIPLCD